MTRQSKEQHMRHARRPFHSSPATELATHSASQPAVDPSSVVLDLEPSPSVTRAIVAGYDGSPLAQAAVVEAGLRAGNSGCVFVVAAYRMPPTFLGWPYFDRRLTTARAAGERELAELLCGRTLLPDAEYIAELIAGSPAAAIAGVAAARHAEAIVVGASSARRIGGKRRSVSRQLERIVEVPVITIH
jgi:nucleotide-binding universal stress UspA family protein